VEELGWIGQIWKHCEVWRWLVLIGRSVANHTTGWLCEAYTSGECALGIVIRVCYAVSGMTRHTKHPVGVVGCVLFCCVCRWFLRWGHARSLSEAGSYAYLRCWYWTWEGVGE